MADEVNITEEHEWFTGARKVFAFTIDTTDNMATWTDMEWVLRKSPTEDSYMIRKILGAGLTIDAPNKTVTLVVDATDTANLEPGVFNHGLKRLDTAKPTVLSYGTAVLQQVATH